jgi:hypothetical protein
MDKFCQILPCHLSYPQGFIISSQGRNHRSLTLSRTFQTSQGKQTITEQMVINGKFDTRLITQP